MWEGMKVFPNTCPNTHRPNTHRRSPIKRMNKFAYNNCCGDCYDVKYNAFPFDCFLNCSERAADRAPPRKVSTKTNDASDESNKKNDKE